MDLDVLRTRIATKLGNGDHAGAEGLCLRLAERDNSGEGDYLLAVVRLGQGRVDDALGLFATAVEKQPQRADIAFNFANALRQAGMLDRAIGEWTRTIELAPDHADAFFNLARAASELGRDEAAAELYGAVRQLRPDHLDTLYNLGNIRYRLGDFVAAGEVFADLVKRQPKFVQGWVNYGLTARALGMESDAEMLYRIALKYDPDSVGAHWNLAVLLLSQGRWREGLPEFEWRLALPDAPKPNWPWPRWTGAEPAGTRVLVWNDQGRGDAIQFLRFAAMIAERGHRVFAFVQDDLKALAATIPGIEAAIGFSEPPPEIDVEAPLLSLPHLLGLDSPSAWQGPYVDGGQANVLPSDPARIRVGVVWAGNPTHANDRNRSLQFSEIAPLFTIGSVEWVSLQVGQAADELSGSEWAGTVRDLVPDLTDFAQTAAAIRDLDLVISVDTAVAHLAGAMERPVWVLLPAVGTDWRWGNDGEVVTPWYPSMRLFHQTKAGDWAGALAEVKTTLEAVLPG